MMMTIKRFFPRNRKYYTIFCGIVFIAVICSISGNALAGEITGKVTAPRAKYAYNTVVYIDKIPDKTFTPPEKNLVMDQIKMKFVPHVLPVMVGTTVDFLNNDEVLHNIFTPDKIADKFNLGTYPKGVIKSHTFDKPGDAVMLCNVHPEMEAWIYVVESPYFAVVGKDGSYSILDVPAGDYMVKVWNKMKKLKAEGNPFTVKVPAEGAVILDITLKR